MEQLKQRAFASAFGALDSKEALQRYFDVFEKETKNEEEDYEVDEFIPETEGDITEMINATRRAGLIQ